MGGRVGGRVGGRMATQLRTRILAYMLRRTLINADDNINDVVHGPVRSGLMVLREPFVAGPDRTRLSKCGWSWAVHNSELKPA